MNDQPPPDQGYAQQRTRTGRVKPAREFDRTSLDSDAYGYKVHRDYAAHFFRWGFVRKFIDKTKTVLDVGCGVDLPLIKTLAGGYANAVPAAYLGVDLNKLSLQPNVTWATLIEQFNFAENYERFDPEYDVVVCLEVIEHMTVEHGEKLLRGLKHCLSETGTLILSTPVFNGIAAANHVHEYEIKELQTLIEGVGLRVEKRYGTFASYHQLKRVITPGQLATLDALNEYYHGDVTACFLAPLYPDASRNNCWVLKHA